ncbi:hypothetical protein [Leptospira levettii]|uniref:hypothetical protein n=1 Tax=Leptospira levettii TaxID=2023178 RepID=UPI000C2ACC7A|nr:hypothetical protein [Leptospira levettii]PJZ89547.1 hypothetical protein CH368_06205 [Leptospira levettii]
MPTFLGPYSYDDYPTSTPNKPVKISQIKLSYANPLSQVNLGDIVALNGIVIEAIVKVVTAFEGSSLPSMTIGSNTLPAKYLTEESVDFEVEGIYKKSIFEPVISNEQPRVYWNPNGATAGELLIFLIFSEP